MVWGASACGALIIWNGIWGFTGLFQLTLDRPVPAVRYIVDASYWMYLIHLPITIWLPGVLVRTQIGAFAKFGIVLGVTVLVCVVTYDLIVRNTFIGFILNGRRYPRALRFRRKETDPSEEAVSAE
jgi:peptidoglycan/LPS O-acetylase OafA/YrhL